MFVCEICGFKTVNSDNYNAHVSVHRPSEDSGMGSSPGSDAAAAAARRPESPTTQLVNGILGRTSSVG